jgi:hypothetical protein
MLMLDNSMLADGATREKEKAQKIATFHAELENMKILPAAGSALECRESQLERP